MIDHLIILLGRICHPSLSTLSPTHFTIDTENKHYNVTREGKTITKTLLSKSLNINNKIANERTITTQTHGK